MDRVLVAGVDTSTQSCKVRDTDAATGELVRFGQAKHPAGSTVNPDHWWRAFQEAASLAGGLDDVAAIAVGGQQHGMVALDEQGRVTLPIIVYSSNYIGRPHVAPRTPQCAAPGGRPSKGVISWTEFLWPA